MREGEEAREAGSGELRKTLIELKARVDSPQGIEGRLRAAGATFQSTLRQRDIYFGGVRGRLKLRFQRPGKDQLVWYDRPDKADTKESRIVLSALPPDHGLEGVLTPALGVRVVVAKVRKVFDWRGTRVHLDEVEGLGSFLEFEKTLDHPESAPLRPRRAQGYAGRAFRPVRGDGERVLLRPPRAERFSRGRPSASVRRGAFPLRASLPARGATLRATTHRRIAIFRVFRNPVFSNMPRVPLHRKEEEVLSSV